jgi:hypothetical protein
MTRLSWFLPLVLTFGFGLGLAAAPAPAKLPEGREVIQNGLFNKSKTGPVGWMTRDSGGLGNFKLLPPAGGDESGILQITCTKTCPRPWYLELRQRVGDSLLRGERLFISFEYKLSKGYAFHFYWQKESAPWPKFLSLRLAEPAGEWSKVQVAVPVDEDLASGASSLTFHLAEELGTVQLRNIRAIAVSPRVDPNSLPSTVEPVFGGDFYDKDWRNAALARIAEVRQSPVRVLVRDGRKPVPGATVKLKQISRPFSVGVEVKAPLLVPQGLDHPDLNLLSQRVGEARKLLPAYRKKVLESGLFDAMTLATAFMWPEYDKWGREMGRKAAEMAKAHHLTVHGHALLCPSFEFLPDPVAYRRMTPEALSNRVLHHIRTTVKEDRGLVDRWEVLFGPLTYDEVYDATGVDLLPASFLAARQEAPDTPLFLADARGLMEPTPDHISETVELIQWLAMEKAPVDGVVLNARLTQPYTAPQAMDERLGVVGRELDGMPVYIASLELDVAREEAQAHMLRDLLISFFSQNQVSGISLSNIWAAEAPKPSAALYRADLSPKPSGLMLEKLLNETWRTNADLTTAERGTAWVRAYHGTYDVTVLVGKRKLSGQVNVVPGGTDIVVNLKTEENAVSSQPLAVTRVPDSVKVATTKASWQTPLETETPPAPAAEAPTAPLPPGIAPPMDDDEAEAPPPKRKPADRPAKRKAAPGDQPAKRKPAGGRTKADAPAEEK